MKPVDFPGSNVVLAQNQDEYEDLPGYIDVDNPHLFVCKWKLSFRERIKMFLKGELWHQVWTFGNPLQPQYLTLKRDEVLTYNDEQK